MSDQGFLARWARRKALVQSGEMPAEPALSGPPQPPVEAAPPAVPVDIAAAPPGATPADEPAAVAPPPTMDDVARLGPDADYTPFVAPGVDEGVKRAAMKKLFADPHFNVMDGLDTYIDDYSKPDPIPLAMLRQMAQSKFLGLFDDEEAKAEAAAAQASPDGAGGAAVPQSLPEPEAVPHEDTDLRLQQDDAAGPGGPRESPGA